MVCCQDKLQIHKLYISLLPTFDRVAWGNILLVQNVLPRHKFTAWLAAHRRLPTVDRLANFGIIIPSLCVFCKQHEESFQHLYFEWCITKRLWTRIGNWLGYSRQILDWNSELLWICSIARSRAWRKAITAAAFVHTVALIWKSRNMARFQNTDYNEERTTREVAFLIHVHGRRKRKWEKGLRRLNYFP